ncbi:nucleoside recognition domain-containing protein [Thermosyntropha sp.]|uniref:nucleoside recognition domain-containing protein n=1 Tax=Thermosyntropha sp. TaxID=2740820 RepID=UPI0025DB32E9|nr:nucleoside recognition domain-containing protein [Thermosyntropha sp.]MBO8158752.1 hypothetical protein [Thermosyntropha sp.]
MQPINIILEVVKGSITLVIQLSLIIIGIMILIEFLQTYNILNKLTAFITPITKLAGISRNGNLSILAGLLLGIGYGGAIIIDSAQQGKLKPEEIYLINLFLVICHSLVEDTLIWLAIGAKVIHIQIARLFLAILICFICSWYLQRINTDRQNINL